MTTENNSPEINAEVSQETIQVETATNANIQESVGETADSNTISTPEIKSEENSDDVTVETATVETATVETSSSAPESEAIEVKAEETKSDTDKNVVNESTEKSSEEIADAKAKAESNGKTDEVLAELQKVKDDNGTIEVTIDEKVRGGFRAKYKDCPMFLPVSHYSLERNPSDKELETVVGRTFEVKVFDIKEETKTVILSRKALLESAVWDNIKVGDKVEGIVSSTPTFGLFLDLGGVEGLIHVSRLSRSHVEHPNQIARKGDKLEAIVLEVNQEKGRIALSRQELEPNPWEGVESEFPPQCVVKGTVRKLTNFGAYIELKPGIDGLLRTGEMSWTKRIGKPSDLLKEGQVIDISVQSINADKQSMTLSIKRLESNPWTTLAEKLPVKSLHNGVVTQINEKGVILTVNDFIDGFMPRSKMRPILIDGNMVPYELNQTVEVVITEIIAEQESLILSPNIDKETLENYQKSRPQRKDSRGGGKGGPRRDRNNPPRGKETPPQDTSFSFGDLLNQSSLKVLSKIK